MASLCIFLERCEGVGHRIETHVQVMPIFGGGLMKIAVVIARVLLGIAFLFAGVMKFLPMKPGSIPPGDAGAMMGLMMAHKWMVLYGLIEAVSGLLLLAGRFVPLALTLLGPVIVNIVLLHSLMQPSGLPLALVVTVLWAVTAWSVRSAFAGLLVVKHERLA